MSSPKFLYHDFWKDATLTEGTQHENFPAENTQHRDFNKAWMSQYGAGSGWGRFAISTASDKIDFEETASTLLVATLTSKSYNADTLATEIKTQLEAAGASTYTVTYSDTANKFKIVSNGAGGGGIFNLLWNTGANKATSVADTLGYSDLADDTGSLTYWSNAVRIHSSEIITADFAAAKDIDAVVIRDHNIQAVAQVQFSTDNFSTVAETITFTTQDDILILEWDTPKQYRYARIKIVDVDNPDLYVKLGTVFMCGDFQPTKSYRDPVDMEPMDPSVLMPSAGGQVSSIQYDQYDVTTYSFPVISQKSSFETIITAVGTSKAWFFCEDPDSPLTTTKYVMARSWRWRSDDSSNWELSVTLEEMR